MASTSACRQNFHVDVESALNKQINLELYASHVYLTIASYFDQDDVALKGFHKFFKECSDEEREHGEKMMKYLNVRGGRLVMKGIEDPPSQANYSSPLLALQFALFLEKKVNQSLLDMHKVSSDRNDPQFCDFIECEYLKEQVESMKKLSDLITNVNRVGEGLGVYMLDKELQS
ncbi:soma ferritin isoform X1 [Cloeon dipterum]|uniref:soma ferritin isoform X1 n=1 Tax=Cloeon dipterum TaxID=197152 RepID=UPI0032206D08